MVKTKNILRRILLTVVAVLTVTGAMGISAVPVHAAAGDVTVTGNVTKATDEEIEAGDKIISITTPTSGITNDDAITYTIYKIFNASNATGGGTAYTTIDGGLTLPVYDTGSDSVALSKFDVDSAGNVKYYTREQLSTTYRGRTIYYYSDWQENSTATQLTNNMVSELSKQESVDKYTQIGTVTITGPNQTAHVKVPDYGFYYISTFVGSAAGIDTTHPSITIHDKTPFPSIDKQQSLTDGGGEPKEDKNGNYKMPDISYSNEPLSASIGDTIYYKVPVTIPKDCDHPIIITDLVSEGLTLDTSGNSSILAVVDEASFALGNTVGPGANGSFRNYIISPWGQDITIDNFSTYKTSWTAADGEFDENGNTWSDSSTGLKYKKYLVTVPDGLMRFLKWAAGYGTVDKNTYNFTLYYKATLNANAQNERTEKNRVRLTYEQYTSPFHEVQVTPYGFDLVKTDKDNKVLGLNASNGGIGNAGSYATFKLYKANADGTDISGDPISFVETSKTVAEDSSDANKGLINNYRVATSDEKNTATSTIKAGDVRISGLAAGTYYLVEDKAPDGYNKITSNVKVVVGENGITVGSETANIERYATVTAVETGTSGPKSATYTSGGVEVENQAGTVLPSTGGIGTTIFYIAGGVIIVIAVILLVKRKKNNQ